MAAAADGRTERLTLPETFVWTKMGWESGVKPAAILRQKEVERQEQGGLFYWGVGTSPSLPRLLAFRERNPTPLVVFTRMVSRPRESDFDPPGTVAWRSYIDPETREKQQLPTLWCEISRDRERSYALVCRRATPIAPHPTDLILRAAEYRNFCSPSKSERLDSRQVTDIVEHCRAAVEDGAGGVPVHFTANLLWPYIVRLADPFPVPVGTEGRRL
jgi:hypothetical protein